MAGQKFNPQNTFRKAQKLHQSGQLYQAEQLYLRVIKSSPAYGPAYHFLSQVLAAQNKLDQARRVLEKGLARNPKDGDLLSAMSSFLVQSGETEKGIKYAQQMVAVHPERAEAHYNLGNLYLHLQRNAEALESLEKAVALKSNFPEALYNLGTLQYQNGHLETAKSSLRGAIEHDPKMVSAYVNLGYIESEEHHYEEAIKWYELVVEKFPDYQAIYEKIGMVYHVSGRLGDAETAYKKALQHDPKNVETITLMGNLMRDLGRPQDAIPYFEQALKIDPEAGIAKSNLLNLQNKRIFSWHFSMLADQARNEAFEKAIQGAVTKDSTVLDIGTGSGLLAMMAARAEAAKVIACEMVPTLAEVATKVIADNGFAERITVLNEKSTALSAEKHLPEKADVLVSEILDVGLLGEGVLPTFRHAIQNLLKPEATIIPQGAALHAVLIESAELAQVNPVRQISGFDLRAFDALRDTTEYQKINLREHQYKTLSDIFLAKDIDFRTPQPVFSIDDPAVTPLEVPITSSGTVHGIAFWFDLQLNDSLSLSSGPEGGMGHWGQAVYFFKDQPEVVDGEVFHLEMLQSEILIQFRNKVQS
ncbi:MAG: tetratricopeptide repeat protein [Salibacteraceae bacterium]